MERLTNITSRPSGSNSQYRSHPFAENPPPKENNFNFLSYFVDPDPRISDWKRVWAGFSLGFPFLFLASCADSSDDRSRPALATNERMQGFQRIIRSESYAGRLVIFLESGEEGAVSSQLSAISERYPGIKFTRSTSRTVEEESSRRQELEARTGKKFLDWNRVYYVDVRDKATAERLIAELMTTPSVRLVYPEQIKHGPGLATTPNLEGLQTYLEGSESGGLNITYAWDQGVYGAGVMVVDDDNGYNLDHNEFDLAFRAPFNGGNIWGAGCDPSVADDPRYFCSSSNVAHGTATTGIIHAQHGPDDDEDGMKGIAPSAWTTIGSPLEPASDLPKGAIYLWECAEQYSYDGRVTCQEEASGLACVPCASAPLAYAEMREVVLSGDITILLTAGNGAINLDETQLIDDETMEEICGGPSDDPATADCWETSGAILVGASQGDRDMVEGQPQKQSYSNCGEDVELYGWGERVVTTTWHPESGPLEGYDWVDDGEDTDPPNDDVNAFFTNQFGGTSAAAAMVAGAPTLVQSYFKDISDGTTAGDGGLAEHRYLRPSKLKEILVNSGVDAYTADGCGIGKQPQMDVAFGLMDAFWDETLSAYPGLNSAEGLTMDDVAALHDLGVGVLCGYDGLGDFACPYRSRPITCTREWPYGVSECLSEDIVPHLSKKMDVDEDGRGDLISWSRGEWKIDLSRGGLRSTGDNYGAWNVTLTYPPVSDWEVPVVMDYDSDGKADLAIYDRENGQWNIAVTSAVMLSGELGGWNYTIDWPGVGDSNVYGDEWYTRPLPADYNGDNWTDLAVQTSDGHWKINFDWRNAEDGWSGRRFEEYGPLIPSYADSSGIKDLAYLSDEELEAYPGWAYLPAGIAAGAYPTLAWRGPGGDVMELDTVRGTRFNASDYGLPALGGIENIPVDGNFVNGGLGVKTSDGYWRYWADSYIGINEPEPNGIFGGNDCRPFVADLDGDGLDDRAVMCPDEWRIVYSASTFASQNDEEGVRHVELGYADPAALPGCPVFGGLSYETVHNVRNYMADLGLNNVPPLFDYAMTPYEYCDLPWFVGDLPEECL